MTNRDCILDFLQGIAPADVSNSEIAARTGVRPHQQVFMITRDLMHDGWIKGLQAGHEWRFWFEPSDRCQSAVRATEPSTPTTIDVPYSWDTPKSVACRLGMTWTGIGRLLLKNGRLTFPTIGAIPGLYRFRIRRGDSEASYIGETENLVRRFALYANPGPSQQTNLRLNAMFRQALSEGAEVGVAVITEGARIDLTGTPTVADLTQKSVRRLFENAAIIEGLGAAIESLNR